MNDLNTFSIAPPGLLSRIDPPVRKVALFRARRLGDFVCATPAFRALRHALPDAEIVFVGLPFAGPLVDRSPCLDRFVPFPGAPGIAEQLYDRRKLDDFYATLRAEQFDLVIQMHSSGVFSNPVALMLGGRFTAGFVRPGDPAGGLDAALAYPADCHEVEKLLCLTRFLGARDRGRQFEFPLTARDREEGDALLGASAGLIGIHAAAEAKIKRWDPARFASVAERLVHGGERKIVLLGRETGGNDVLTAARPLDLRGRTSLPVLGAVISRLTLLLTNDSGPAHIAYAVRTPSVTIFGGTSPSEWGSPDPMRHQDVYSPIDCRPCSEDDCPIGYRCLQEVQTDQVLAAARQVLGDMTLQRSLPDEPEDRIVAV